MPVPTVRSFGLPSAREGSDVRLLRAIHLHGLMNADGWLDAEFEGLSQADAASLTGLSRPSISTLAKSFRQRKLLVETSGLALNPRLGLACGIDIGFGQVRLAVSDLHGQLLRQEPNEHRVSFGDEADRSITWMATSLTDLVKEAREVINEATPVVGVAISIAGPVDRDTGKLKRSWGIGGDWQFLSAIRQLQQRLGWSTHYTIDRDANSSAIAEALWGMAQDPGDVLYVKWSEGGVAAALIIQHEIVRGADGIAGEIGHAIVRTKPDKEDDCLREWFELRGPCPHCHRHGCLQTVASLAALRDYVRDDQLSTEQLLALARAKTDQSSKDSAEYRTWHGLDVAARCLGRVLAPLIDTLNPKLVIIGGKIGAQAYPMVTRALNDSIKAGEVTPAIESLETSGAAPRLTGKTSVLGAVALALLEGSPARFEKLLEDTEDQATNGATSRQVG
ncbi:MAG: ROK family protein [Solirubrobacteraceae bacterium]